MQLITEVPMNRKLTAAAAAVMLTACIVLDSRFTLETTEYSIWARCPQCR